MSLYNYSDVIPLSGRRPVWGSGVSVVPNSTVHTSCLFIPCSDGLINGYEHTFDFLNQIVTPRRPVWGSGVSVVPNSTVHTSCLFIPCSDGLINGYEHTFDFLNQIVTPRVFILFSLKSKSLTCARARESNKRRNTCVRSLACMGVNLGMNSMNRRRKRINKSNKYSILKGEQKV